MKRLLRYLFYREIYRALREAMRSSGSGGESGRDETARQRGGDRRTAEVETSRLPDPGQALENETQLKAALQQMEFYDFEHFVGDLWERMGWQTEVSTESADEGVDVTARKDVPYEQVTLIQAKRYGPNTTVGSPDIQQYASLKKQYDGVDKVAIVTTNEFTQQARELADRLNVKLINGDDLVELVVANDAADLVAEYLEFLELDDAAEQDQQAPTSQRAHAPDPGDRASQPRRGEIPTTPWQGVVAAATLGWIALLFTIDLLPEVVGGLVILAVWIGLPVGLYLDSRTVYEYVDWPEHRWLYLAGAVLWLVAVVPGAVYLWKRYQFARQTDSARTGA